MHSPIHVDIKLPPSPPSDSLNSVRGGDDRVILVIRGAPDITNPPRYYCSDCGVQRPVVELAGPAMGRRKTGVTDWTKHKTSRVGEDRLYEAPAFGIDTTTKFLDSATPPSSPWYGRRNRLRGTIAWYENIDGLKGNWTVHLLTRNASVGREGNASNMSTSAMQLWLFAMLLIIAGVTLMCCCIVSTLRWKPAFAAKICWNRRDENRNHVVATMDLSTDPGQSLLTTQSIPKPASELHFVECRLCRSQQSV